MKERYIRQEAIEGLNRETGSIEKWNQEAIDKSRLALIGSDEFLLSVLASSAACMGFGEIFVLGKMQEFYENPLVKMYNIKAPIFNYKILESLLPEVDVIVDCSNNLRSKRACLNYAEKHNKQTLLAYCNKKSLAFATNSENRNLEDLVELQEFENQEAGKISSVVLAGMIVDEIRKKRMLMRNDKLYDVFLDSFFYDGFKPLNLDKKVLQIGAGAIGTYTGMLLAFTSCKVDLVDFDVAEESNLNRQIFFHDALGEYKAEAMARKLNMLGRERSFKPIVKKVNETWKYFENEKPDLILGCVDNAEARLILNEFASKYKIPYVDGGTSLSGGTINCYVPGKTACLDCQTHGELRKIMKKDKEREARRLRGEENEEEDCFDPSMLVPNQVAGGLAINEALRMFNNELDASLVYRCRSGISRTPLKVEKCKEGCKYN